MARHKEKKQLAGSGSGSSTKRGGGGGRSNGAGSDAIAMKKAGRVNRITSSRDAGFTGQDAFGMGDDEIALDGGARRAGGGGRRGYSDEDDDDEMDDLTQDEVLSLKLPSSSSGISTRHLHQKQQQEDEEDDDDDDASQATAGQGRSAIKLNTRIKNRERDLQPLTDARTSRFDKLKQDGKRKRKAAASDDGEVDDSDEHEARQDGEQQDSDDESVASSAAADPDKEDLKGGWATAGGYYLSKGEVARAEERQHRQQEGRRGQVDDEQREQEALELYEARRIQKEGKENLHEADYGLDSDGDEEDATRLADMDADLSASVRANGAQAPARFDTREEAIAHLVSTEPELLALLDDLSRNAERLPTVKAVVKNMQVSLASDNPKVGFGLLYQETLATYLTTLVFYLHVRSHPAFPSVGGDIASAALDRLLKLREALSTLDDLGIGAIPEDEQRKDMYTGSDEEGDSAEEADGDENEEDALALEELDRETLLAQIGDLDDDELEALIAERQAIMEHEGVGNGKTNGVAVKQAGNRRALQAAEDGSESDGEPDIAQPAKRSRKRRRTKQAASSAGGGNTLGDLLNLAPLPASSRAARPSASASADSDLVDPTALSAGDAEDKAGRTKSLRFYTSKIAAASARRTGANRERGGGDDDVPYRSKERARAAVLQRQQHAQKAQDAKGAELDDAEFGEDDLVDARAVSGSSATAEPDADAEGYYDLVSRGKKAARAAKKEAYDAAVEEDRMALSTSQPLDPNNPRAVNRMIMANKGLTPKRPKSVRNPRVKKRMRYESAQKKVASMKPVYKGGLGSASYEGEKSGISSKVVKSRAL